MACIANKYDRQAAALALAGYTRAGQQFLEQSAHWPPVARELHLLGKLGPAGAWDKLMPPSWTGWLQDTIIFVLDAAFKYAGNPLRTTYDILRLRAYITSQAVRLFCNKYPHLMIH